MFSGTPVNPSPLTIATQAFLQGLSVPAYKEQNKSAQAEYDRMLHAASGTNPYSPGAWLAKVGPDGEPVYNTTPKPAAAPVVRQESTKPWIPTDDVPSNTSIGHFNKPDPAVVEAAGLKRRQGLEDKAQQKRIDAYNKQQQYDDNERRSLVELLDMQERGRTPGSTHTPEDEYSAYYNEATSAPNPGVEENQAEMKRTGKTYAEIEKDRQEFFRNRPTPLTMDEWLDANGGSAISSPNRVWTGYEYITKSEADRRAKEADIARLWGNHPGPEIKRPELKTVFPGVVSRTGQSRSAT